MALDARQRSRLYTKLIPVLGEDDANALATEFPSAEAEELVTKQFLRAELADLRTELGERMHRPSITVVATIVAAAAMLEALQTVLT